MAFYKKAPKLYKTFFLNYFIFAQTNRKQFDLQDRSYHFSFPPPAQLDGLCAE